MPTPPTVVIGAGHNGLTAAFYLARAGLRPIVLERRHEVGGGAITGEIHPGFRCPTLTHEAMLHAGIAREMDLPRHGLERVAAEPLVYAPALEGPSLVLHADPRRTADRLRAVNAADAGAYGAFREALSRIAGALGAVLTMPPPDLDAPGARDLWDLLRLGRRVKALGRRDGYRLLRWATMPAADFVHEWFDTDLLCAAIAAPGLSGTRLGPRSAGGTLVLLLREAHRQLAGDFAAAARGGPGALTAAMAAAATAAGAEIRTGASVDRILVRDGRVTGVLTNGRELPAATIVSAVDPKTTFLQLVDPIELEPDFASNLRNYRSAGTVAKVNLALASLPAFGGRPVDEQVLAGRIHIGPGLDALERAFDDAKYGEVSREPWLEMTIPSIRDPTLAPPGRHVASIYVHYAPCHLRHTSWDAAREPLLERVLRTLDAHAPGTSQHVLAAQVVTPAELEREYGFAGGHIFHGELALDQLFTMRPVLGWSRYASPIQGLFLCGAGTHPGGFLTGAAGRLAAAEVLGRSRR